MSNVTLLLVVGITTLGLLAGAGLLVFGFRGTPAGVSRSAFSRFDPSPVIAQPRKLSLCVGAGIVVGLLTGWPVAAVAGGLAVWFAPVLLGNDPAEADRTAQIEAVAVWAEMLRDTLSAAAGLEQAVLASTSVAPSAIAGPLGALGSELRSRRPFSEAMAALAEALADPTADQVIASLVYAQKNQARNLADLLGELAEAARAQVTLAVRVHAERAKHRSAQRTVTVTFAGMAAGLTVAYPKFLAPYNSVTGQIVLAIVIGMFAGGLAWMQVIVRPRPVPRLLAPGRDGES